MPSRPPRMALAHARLMMTSSGKDSERNQTHLPTGSGRKAFWYSLPMLLSPVIVIAAAALIIPTQWFALHSGSTYLSNIGYAQTLHNKDCQVLVYGDSAAMVGIDPRIITAKTGMSACNIAEFAGVSILSGTLPLDLFLKNNPRPRYLVFFYAPEDLDLQSQRAVVPLFEATTWRMRQPHRLSLLLHSMAHPDEFVAWAGQGLRLAIGGLGTQAMKPEVSNMRDSTLGLFPMEGKSLAACADLTSRPGTSRPDRTWMSGLRSRYGVAGTTVLVDVMPLNSCDSRLGFFKTELSGLTDNEVTTLPVSLFVDAHHVSQQGVAALSNLLADQLNDHRHAAPQGTR